MDTDGAHQQGDVMMPNSNGGTGQGMLDEASLQQLMESGTVGEDRYLHTCAF